MTSEEFERGLKVAQDNLAVHSKVLDRVETNLDRLEAVVDALAQRVDGLTDAVGAITQAVSGLTEVAQGHERQLQGHDQQLRIMQAAMAALFERMDRFIRGLETNGHQGRGEA